MAVSLGRRLLKRYVGCGLVLFLMLAMFGNSVASAAGVPMDAAKAKQIVIEHGTSAVVKVTMRDGTKVRGEIVAIRDDDFDLRTKNATFLPIGIRKKAPSPPLSIRYDQVKKLGSPGNGSTAEWLLPLILVGLYLLAAALGGSFWGD